MPAISAVLERAIERGLFDAPPHSAVFYDLDLVRDRIGSLHAAFPPASLHAVAIKACPFTELLRLAGGMGCGAEAASAVEFEQALGAGIPPDHVIFDSPAKTMSELRTAMTAGAHINADSVQELDRIAALVDLASSSTSYGVRINPEVGAGVIEETSTAMAGAKFGVSLHDNKRELLERFGRHAWLTGLHVHVGSQGCSLDLLVEGVRRTVEFAGEVERQSGRRITTFDIGGGLPAAYRHAESVPGFEEYATALRERVPELFSADWRLVTEFGRAIWASTCWAATRVEYTKKCHGREVAIVHLGADMFLRVAYRPDKWYHELRVCDARGIEKSDDLVSQDVAGPLCFSGDLIARGRPLPRIEPGDYVVIEDAGAYTFSMWSRYNSRLAPAVYGYSTGRPDFQLLKPPETPPDGLRFWGPEAGLCISLALGGRNRLRSTKVESRRKTATENTVSFLPRLSWQPYCSIDRLLHCSAWIVHEPQRRFMNDPG